MLLQRDPGTSLGLTPPVLKAKAGLVHILVAAIDEITIPSLSVNKLCAGDLAVLFCGPHAAAFKPHQQIIQVDGEPALLGSMYKQTELHVVDVHGTSTSTLPRVKETRIQPNQQFHRANSVITRTTPALINFHHMTLGAPPITTWLSAIDKGWFTSFPELTSVRVKQHCANKVNTAKGHNDNMLHQPSPNNQPSPRAQHTTSPHTSQTSRPSTTPRTKSPWI